MTSLFSNILINSSKDSLKHRIEISSLEPTLGDTLKNLIRRNLLSFSSSYKVFAFGINGVKHELQNKDGLLESTIDIAENLQKINFAHCDSDLLDDNNIYFFTYQGNTKGQIIARNFLNSNVSDINISNDEVVLFTSTSNDSLEVQIYCRKGTGFLTKEQNISYFRNAFKPQDSTMDTLIFMDTDFSFIDELNIIKEEYLSEFNTKKEKLIIEFSSSDENALNFLSHNLFSFGEMLQKISTLNINELVINSTQGSKTNIIDLSMSKRLINCLQSLGITYLQELGNYSLAELKSMRSLGKISLIELEHYMKKYNINFKCDNI